MKRTILALDVFGQSFTPEFEDSKSFKTTIGLIFTIILLTVCIVLSILFGREIYLRQDPYVTTSDSIQNFFQIPLTKIPFFFQLRNPITSKQVNLTEYLTPKTSIYDIINNNVFIRKTSPLEPCSLDYYPDIKNMNFSSDFDITNFYCLNPKNYTIQNMAYSNFSLNFRIDFFKCNKTIQKCANNLEIIFDYLNLIIVYPDSLVDPKNYYNPVSLQYIGSQNLLSNVLAKAQLFKYSLNNLVSNYGWLLESINTLEYIKFVSSDNDYNIISANSVFPKYIFLLGGSSIGKTVSRSYMKIQDLFAKIGGIANAAYIICYIISYDYLRFKYLFNVRDLLLAQLDSNKNCNKNDSENNLNEDRPSNADISHFINNNKHNILKENRNNLPDELKNNRSPNHENKLILSTINNVNNIPNVNKSELNNDYSKNPLADDKRPINFLNSNIRKINSMHKENSQNEEWAKSMRKNDQSVEGRSVFMNDINREIQDNNLNNLKLQDYDSKENTDTKNEIKHIVGELGKLKIEVTELVKNNLNISNYPLGRGNLIVSNNFIKSPSLIKIRKIDLNEYANAFEEIIPKGNETYFDYLSTYVCWNTPLRERYDKVIKIIKNTIKIDLIWRLIAENFNSKE